jgi:hypothetical protein
MAQSYMDSQATYVDKDSMIGLRPVVVGTSDATLTAENSGTIYIATKSSGTQTFTLPSAATAGAGCQFTFICGHASGEINFVTVGTDDTIATHFAAVGTDADTAIITTTDKGLKNTAATNAIGDQCTIVSDGVGTWYGLGINCGIWATL